MPSTIKIVQWLNQWFLLLVLFTIAPSALAQIRPDNSLGSEPSQLRHDVQSRQQGQRIIIEGGSNRSPLLFHSFEQLSIADDQQVFFANPRTTEFIITRITGPRSSTIDGTLGVLGSADLFLLNPNGITFGPNAELDIVGSLTVSTADQIYVDDLDFSAVNPTTVPLLTLSMTPGIQLGANALDRLIQNQANLVLERGRSLTLDAGTIDQTGTIVIPTGTVQLQGETLQLTGTVDTRAGSNPRAGGNQVGQLRVRSPSDLTIHPTGPLTNQAISDALQSNEVVVESDRTLTLRGTISSSSPNPLTLRAGRNLRLLTIEEENGVASGQDVSEFRGNVTLQSSRNLLIENPIHLTRSQVPQLTLEAGGRVVLQTNEQNEPPERLESDRIRMLQLMGNGGILSIAAQSLKLKNTAIRTIAGDGDTGPEIGLDLERTLTMQRSQIDTRIGDGEQGGSIDIQVGRSLRATNSIINTGFFRDEANGGTSDTFGAIPDILSDNISRTSQTGSIHLDVGNIILLRGSQVRTTSFTGNAGDIGIFAQHLILDGSDEISVLATDTNFGSTGNAGRIDIHTTESVELIGNQPEPFLIPLPESFGLDIVVDFVFNNTGISAPSLASGLSSLITIRTGRLSLRDGTFLGNAAGLFQEGGQSGKVTLIADDIHLSGLGGIVSLALGNGDGGDIVVESDRLTLEDGAILAVSSVLGDGNAGNLSINTNQLSVSGGSTIAASTEAGGLGGILDIQARSILLDGTSVDGSVPSTLRTGVSPAATGRGGELHIQTNQLQVLNGAEIRAGTQGTPDAGDITLNANAITVAGVGPNGQPSIIQTESSLPPGAATPAIGLGINTSDMELGAAGDIQISAERVTVSDRAAISTRSQQGDGGDIRLDVDDYLLLRRGGSISATAGVAATTDGVGTDGNGGNIDIETTFIIAPADENSDITANAFEGAGGNITLRTNGLLLGIAFRKELTELSDITASSQFGLAGTVTIEGATDELAPSPLQLPSGVGNSEDRLVAGCLLDEDANFVVTGRGGIPANPSETLNQALIWEDARASSGTHSGSIPEVMPDANLGVNSGAIAPTPLGTRIDPGVNRTMLYKHTLGSDTLGPDISTVAEAQGWQINSQGQVELMAATDDRVGSGFLAVLQCPTRH